MGKRSVRVPTGGGVAAKQRKARRPRKRTLGQEKVASDVLIGARIREFRENELNGMTQYDFAKRLDVSRGAVGNWELGKGIARENVQRIATIFNANADWFLTGRGQPRTRAAASLEERMELLPPDEYQQLYADFETLVESRLARMRGAGRSVGKRGENKK